MEPNIQRNGDDCRRIVVRTPYVRNRRDGSAQAAQWDHLCRSSIAVRSPMVALSACPGRHEVVVWASYWRRGRSGNAIGLTKVARQSAVRAQHAPYCSHTEERFSDIWRTHGDLVGSIGRHGRSMVTVLCDGGLSVVYGGVLAAIICVPTACARRRRGALGDLTALLLRCRCEPTAFTWRSFRSPWERRATDRTLCMHKVRALAWRPRRPHGVQWRCHGDPSAL